MPRDHDKDNAPPRGRRDRQASGKGAGGKGRSGVPRSADKKFAKRSSEGGAKPYAGKREGFRQADDRPRPARFDRDDRPTRSRDDRPERGPRKEFRPREDRAEEANLGKVSRPGGLIL